MDETWIFQCFVLPVLPNPPLSRLYWTAAHHFLPGGPTGFSSCSILVPGCKSTLHSSAVSLMSASSPCASICSCLLHSTSCCPFMYEGVAFRSLWSPPPTKAAPLYLCDAVLASIAVPVRESQNVRTVKTVTVERRRYWMWDSQTQTWPLWVASSQRNPVIVKAVCVQRGHIEPDSRCSWLIGLVTSDYWQLYSHWATLTSG